MIYTIKIENLLIEAIIGILPDERIKKQRIKVDFSCTYNRKKQSAFLNYKDIKDFIESSFDRNFELLEDALDFFEENMQIKFSNMDSFNMKIIKLDIFSNCEVSLEITK